MPADAPNPDAVAAIDRAARLRRSVRDFQPGPIDVAEVLRVLELAAKAPSAWNLQPWRFVVVSDPGVRQELRAAANDQRQVEGAPVVIAIATDMVDALARVDEARHPSLPEDASRAIKGNIEAAFARKTAAERDGWGRNQGYILLGYLLLLLEVHGFRTSPMVGFDPAKVRAVLDLPPHAEIPALVAVGHPASDGPMPPPHRHHFAGLVRVIGS